jgi:hypothetical protein
VDRFKLDRRISHAVSVLGAGLLVALPLLASVSFDNALSQTDHREIAGQWIEENVERGTKVAIEHYSIPFDYDQYHVEDVIRIADHDLAWYQQQGYDILIVSDWIWELFRRQPQSYAQKLAAYDEIVNNSTLLAEFVPEPPGIVVAGYPTIEVYHFAPVRIYRLVK